MGRSVAVLFGEGIVPQGALRCVGFWAVDVNLGEGVEARGRGWRWILLFPFREGFGFCRVIGREGILCSLFGEGALGIQGFVDLVILALGVG